MVSSCKIVSDAVRKVNECLPRTRTDTEKVTKSWLEDDVELRNPRRRHYFSLSPSPKWRSNFDHVRFATLTTRFI